MKIFVTAVLAAVVVSLAAPAAQACQKAHTAGTTAAATTTTTTTAVVTPSKPTAAPVAAAPVAAPASFKTVTVADVATRLAQSKTTKQSLIAVFDANSVEMRASAGVIPTSVLLSSSSSYDVALLPTDKATPVVFYCANEQCTASHTAAKRAITAGHSDVAVLSAGIKGWVAAGQAVDKPVG